MARFLVKVSYTAEGARGLMREGGTGRRDAVARMVTGIGGRVEAFYFAHGESDAYAIVELPDAVDSLALSLAVNAAGAVRLTTIPLFTPDEMDEACRQSVEYRPPGG